MSGRIYLGARWRCYRSFLMSLTDIFGYFGELHVKIHSVECSLIHVLGYVFWWTSLIMVTQSFTHAEAEGGSSQYSHMSSLVRIKFQPWGWSNFPPIRFYLKGMCRVSVNHTMYDPMYEPQTSSNQPRILLNALCVWGWSPLATLPRHWDASEWKQRVAWGTEGRGI